MLMILFNIDKKKRQCHYRSNLHSKLKAHITKTTSKCEQMEILIPKSSNNRKTNTKPHSLFNINAHNGTSV